MPSRINPDFAVELADFIVAKIEDGADDALLEIYEGPQPTHPGVAPAGALLVSFTLAADCFQDAVISASGGTAEANPIDPKPGLTGGVAEFFRLTTRDGIPLIDGTVSDLGGGGMLKLSSTTVIAGIDVVIGSLKLTQRAF
jgi:hypothetical protein